MDLTDLKRRLRAALGDDSVYDDAADLLPTNTTAASNSTRPTSSCCPVARRRCRRLSASPRRRGYRSCPRRRHRALRRRRPAPRRHRRLDDAHEPHPRGRPRNRRAVGRARRGQPRAEQARAPARLLLRAGPVQPEGLTSAATSPRTPAGRTASPTASPPTTSSGSRSCCPTATMVGRAAGADVPGYDLTGMLVGSEGTLGIVTKVTRAADAHAGERAHAAGRSSPPIDDATRRGVEVIAPRHRARGAGDDGPASAARRVEPAYHVGFPRTPAPCCWSSSTASPRRAGRDAGRSRPNLPRARRARGAQAADAAERERLWAGRKGALGAIGRARARTTTSRTASCRARSLPEVMRARRGGRASATASPSPTSSTPATATCIPASSSTGATRRDQRVHARPARRSCACASTPAARSPASTASASRSGSRCSTSSYPRPRGDGGPASCLRPARLFNPDKMLPASRAMRRDY